MSNRSRSPDTNEAAARYAPPPPPPRRGTADTMARNAPPPRTGTTTSRTEPLQPAQVWWMQVQSQLDATDKWLGSDPVHGRQYQTVLWRAATGEWDENRQYIEMEKLGMFEWMTGRMAQMPGFSPSGGGGGRGGGGGGGGGGATPEAIATAAATIKNLSASLGVPMNDEQINELATRVVTENWSQDQVYDTLTEAVDWATVQAGTLLAGVDQIRQLANQYLVPISDATAREYSTRVASGEMDEAAIRTLFSTQAQKEYGWMGEALAAGLTPRDFLMPARDRLASTLELNPEDVDLMDPKTLKMMTVTDPETAATRSATLTEVEYAARQDPRYASTRGAQDLTASIGVGIAEAFGGRA